MHSSVSWLLAKATPGQLPCSGLVVGFVGPDAQQSAVAAGVATTTKHNTLVCSHANHCIKNIRFVNQAVMSTDAAKSSPLQLLCVMLSSHA